MKKLNLILLALSLICCVAFGQIVVDPDRDPTAARDDLSNVTPATGRTNLDVFSKAEVSAAIATESADRLSGDNTLTAALATKSLELAGHIASTGTSVHGLGSMAMEAANNYAGASGANISGAAFRSALGVYSAAELATYSAVTSANLTGSNVVATSAFLAAIGGAKLNGDLGQPFQSEDMTVTGSFTHNLASGGYVVYQGWTKSSSAGESFVELPLNWPWTNVNPASGTCGYVMAEVVGKREADLAVCVVKFEGGFHKFDNILTIVGSLSSTTHSFNASDMKAELVFETTGFGINATSSPGTLWQVKKLEIGGL